MKWYYLNDAGEVAGPVSDSTLVELRTINRLADNSQVCREGSEDWISLAEALCPNMIIPGKSAEAAAPSRQFTTKKKNSPKGALIAMIGGVMITAGATFFFLSRGGDPESSDQFASVTEASAGGDPLQKETRNDQTGSEIESPQMLEQRAEGQRMAKGFKPAESKPANNETPERLS